MQMLVKEDGQDSANVESDLRPYVLDVEEVYKGHVVVWAENVFEAIQKAEELHSNCEIELGADHYAGHKIRRSPLKPNDTLLSLIPNYGKDDEND